MPVPEQVRKREGHPTLNDILDQADPDKQFVDDSHATLRTLGLVETVYTMVVVSRAVVLGWIDKVQANQLLAATMVRLRHSDPDAFAEWLRDTQAALEQGADTRTIRNEVGYFQNV